MRLRIPLFCAAIGLLFGYMVLSPFALWMALHVFDQGPFQGMRVLDAYGPSLLRWSLPFTLFTGAMGLLFGLLAMRIKENDTAGHREKPQSELILDSMPAGMITIDRECRIVSANQAFCTHTGFARSEVIGRPCYTIGHGFDRPCEPPNHVCPLQTVLSTGKGVTTVHSHLDRSGHEMRVEIAAAPIRDKDGDIVQILEVISDISARATIENALRESESNYRRLFQDFQCLLDAIPDVLTVYTRDLKIIWANKSAVGRLGRKESTLADQHCYALWHNRTEPCPHCPVLETFATGRTANVRTVTPDHRIWDLRTFPLRQENGRVETVVGLKRDVTEHRRLEDQLHQAQKMEDIGLLAGGIAHDFNNILTAIIGYANLCRRRLAPDDPSRVDVEQILSAAEKAANLTHSLLTFSRKQVINPKPVHLNAIVSDIEKLLHRIIGEDIELKTRLSEKNPVIKADQGQICQILINLATNARDAMPSGGALTIMTEPGSIDAEFVALHQFGRPGEYAQLTVQDTGVGINEEIKDKIFNPFFTTKEVGRGTGLGLSIVYGIVKQHDGYVVAESKPGHGTLFRIYFPLTHSQAQEINASNIFLPKGGAETLLLAEDDDTVRELTSRILTGAGYSVIEAVDGEDAIRQFTRHKEAIDFLLLDVVMPKKNGREVFEYATLLRPDIRALYTSGYAADIIRDRGGLPDNADLINKPVTPADLLNKIRAMLDAPQ